MYRYNVDFDRYFLKNYKIKQNIFKLVNKSFMIFKLVKMSIIYISDILSLYFILFMFHEFLNYTTKILIHSLGQY